jgi:stage II sporulation protein D
MLEAAATEGPGFWGTGTLPPEMRALTAMSALALLATGVAHAGTTFVVEGRGWGHGVGMSQYGAFGFALHGWRHERILAHYYRGTELGSRPNRVVRVLLAEAVPELRIGSRAPFRRLTSHDRTTLRRGDRRLTVAAIRKLGGLVRYEPGAAPLRIDGAPYRGAITVYAAAGRLHAVNHLSLDHYLRGVVPWEVPYYWPREVLRAQAVVARSYTLATLQPGKRFDLVDDTRDQVYGGIRAEKRSTNSAVAATAGRVVIWRGRVATTYYHSTSGGRTAASRDAFRTLGAVPYLQSVPDPYDVLSPRHRWLRRNLTPAELGAVLHVGRADDAVVATDGSGRPARVQVVGSRATRSMSGASFRDALGLGSGWFTLTVLSLDAPARPVRAGERASLTGFARSDGAVRLQKAIGGRGWQPVRRLDRSSRGRFRTVVQPTQTTRYRLVADGATGPVVEVRVER